jgi:hypothetical protein
MVLFPGFGVGDAEIAPGQNARAVRQLEPARNQAPAGNHVPSSQKAAFRTGQFRPMIEIIGPH